jgi:hypothetical protein
MARFFAFATFVVGGIIVADILIHPQGTSAASAGVTQIEKPAFQSLLGTAPSN